MINNWKLYFRSRNSVLILIATIVILVTGVSFLTKFLVYVEGRPGVVLDDPLFHFFGAVDLNIPVFAFIYLSLISCIVYLAITDAHNFIIALQTYTLLIIIRMAMMYVVPLEPPIGTIDLQDPIVFIAGTGTKITKDLFFSGHTSTLFLMFLITRKGWLKNVYLINTLIVGTFVILQKVHYTIDVLVAPFAAFASFKIIKHLNTNYFFPNIPKTE